MTWSHNGPGGGRTAATLAVLLLLAMTLAHASRNEARGGNPNKARAADLSQADSSGFERKNEMRGSDELVHNEKQTVNHQSYFVGKHRLLFPEKVAGENLIKSKTPTFNKEQGKTEELKITENFEMKNLNVLSTKDNMKAKNQQKDSSELIKRTQRRTNKEQERDKNRSGSDNAGLLKEKETEFNQRILADMRKSINRNDKYQSAKQKIQFISYQKVSKFGKILNEKFAKDSLEGSSTELSRDKPFKTVQKIFDVKIGTIENKLSQMQLKNNNPKTEHSSIIKNREIQNKYTNSTCRNKKHKLPFISYHKVSKFDKIFNEKHAKDFQKVINVKIGITQNKLSQIQLENNLRTGHSAIIKKREIPNENKNNRSRNEKHVIPFISYNKVSKFDKILNKKFAKYLLDGSNTELEREKSFKGLQKIFDVKIETMENKLSQIQLQNNISKTGHSSIIKKREIQNGNINNSSSNEKRLFSGNHLNQDANNKHPKERSVFKTAVNKQESSNNNLSVQTHHSLNQKTTSVNKNSTGHKLTHKHQRTISTNSHESKRDFHLSTTDGTERDGKNAPCQFLAENEDQVSGKSRTGRYARNISTTEEFREGRAYLRKKILRDKRRHLDRRRRYVYVSPTQYRYTAVQDCAGWTYYRPYHVSCGRCEPVPVRPPAVMPTYTYTGPAKTWHGPKYGCSCNAFGSEFATCDIVTGQCRCKPHVSGRNCDSCEKGYWGLESGNGCFKCDCDEIGSVDGTCDQKTNQCFCKPGVGGLKCDNCLPGYFGFSTKGCRECDYCNKPGHICDPDTGRCICPPNSRGESCDRCAPNSFGLEVGRGCKSCNCAHPGSVKKQCDVRSGQCECKTGYTGNQCNQCSFGYYGYPRCRRCDCDRAGTEPAKCDSTGLCSCEDTGQCLCKKNVVGRRCNECSNGTFGLHLDNPDGCTQCFCFGRTAHCTESNLTIGHIRLNTSRQLQVEYEHRKHVPYITSYTDSHFQMENHLLVIPGIYEEKQKFKSNTQINKPLYWRLPDEFLGDKILSYGGYLRFAVETVGGTTTLPNNIYPLVQIKGNNRIILEHFQLLPNPYNRHEIRFHESLWRWKDKPNVLVSRDVLMVALQRLQHILIRANDAANFNKVVLHNVTLDTAIPLPGNPPPLAKGVELCECPRQYNSSSCQNPSIGFYRWYDPSHVNGTIIINLVGEARPCECNGRSNVCDTETGHCLNCSENTTGSNCQHCSEGFYGSPMHGKCKPCPCPTNERNFARKCHRLHTGDFKCICKPGYSGPKCDKCKLGYFGHPSKQGGSCKPCNCNKYGSASNECDEETGQCNCKPGISGKDCSQCDSYRHVLQIGGCKPCDNCTQWLLADLDQMSENLDKIYTDYILYDRIRYFYDILDEMTNRSNLLKNTLNEYKALQNKIKSISFVPIDALYDESVKLKNVDVLTETIELQSDIALINKHIHHLRKNIDDIFETIEKVVRDLEQFGTGHIAIKNAVREGRKLLEDIKKFPLAHPELLEKEEYCSNLLRSINTMGTTYNIDLNNVRIDLADFKKRLHDMKNIITNTFDQIDEADTKNNETIWRTNLLKDKINQIKNFDINLDFFNKNQMLIDKSKELFNEARLNYKKLEDSTEFKELLIRLRKKIEDIASSPISKLQELVKKAQKHADKLHRFAEDYRKSFNISHEADIALKASKAYQDIIDILNEAKNTAQDANNAIDNANTIIYPSRKKSLHDDSKKVLKFSELLRNNAENLKTNVNNLIEKQQHLNISITDNQNTIWRTGIKDNELNSKLHNLTQNKKDMLTIIHTANAISNKMKNIYKNATHIKEEIKYKLRPELDKLQKSGVEMVSLGEEKLSVVERNLKSSMDILLSLETNNYIRKSNITKWNDTLSRKLDELKSRILKAKQTADAVRLSLTNKPNSVCSRSYKPYNFGPTTTTNIILTVTLNATNKNSSYLYLPTASQDFMAVQMVNGNIQYLWNLGGNTGILTADLPKDIQNNSWYRVEVERTANTAKLIVYNKETENNPVVAQNSTNPEFTRFDLSMDDKLWIGGIPNSEHTLLSEFLINGAGISGCLNDIVFDGKPIGLWNFVTSTDSCTGCSKNGLETTKSEHCCYFNGIGYSVMPREKNTNIYRRSYTSIRFDFETYDENALLFLAVDVPNNRFVAILLKNGKVQFHIVYSDDSILILTTSEKYNTGKKISVSASRVFQKSKGEMAVIKVNEKSFNGTPANQPKQNSFPNLENGKYYIGGVPPEFHITSNGTTRTLHTHASFLGCIQEINIDNARYNPLDEQHYERYGVEPSCLNKSIKIAGFEGKGYIKMPPQSLHAGSSFGFVFRTLQKDTLILAALNDMDSESDDSYYSISVVAGKLEFRIKSENKESMLTSNITVNDGHYHVLFINKKKKYAELRIDDVLLDKRHVEPGSAIIDGYLYFGGLPAHLNNTDKVSSSNYYVGSIKDVIFNNELVPFNDLISFEKVKIGRSGPLPNLSVPSELSTLMMPRGKALPEGCHKIGSYSLEMGAVKFGDAPYSFVQHNFKSTNFWHTDYSIEFEFRTFYLNGLLFVSPGLREKSRQFILLTLKDNGIQLFIKGKRKKELSLDQKYDDGKWHRISIKTVKRKITLTVDGQVATAKVAKRMNVANSIYIGGIPARGLHIPEAFINRLHQFRGCIRGLKVNDQSQDLIRDSHHKVGQCFPEVEKGSYFAGDAYAVYKYNFVVNVQLELQFEFRTSEQNGIFLSITHPVSKQGLSLELYNGAVVMVENMGNTGPSKVETNLSTEYSLCDNKWHKVSALYSKEEMTVKVDGVVRSSLAINTTFMENKVESALYIGGLPDDASFGTLHTRDGFKGCIRNIVIERQIVDWTDMDELNDILLNSCPVVDS